MVFLLLVACADFGDSSTRSDLHFGNCATCSVQVREVWSSRRRDPNVDDVGTFLQVGDTLFTMRGFAGHRIVGYRLSTSRSFVLDRFGEGPGEFKNVQAGLLDRAGDTLVVVDVGRVSFLTTDLRFVRSFNPPVRIRPRTMIGLHNGDFLVASIASRLPNSEVADGLHRISRSGESLSAFAPMDVSARPKIVASRWPGHAWLLFSEDEGFRIQLWDAEAETLEKTISVQPPWWHSSTMTPHELERHAGDDRLPTAPSTTATTAVEHDGVLWVRVSHAARNWQEWDPAVYDPSGVFDSVLIAIDVNTGEPLASRVFTDVSMVAFLEGGRIASYELEGPGYPRIRLYDFWLEREGRPSL